MSERRVAVLFAVCLAVLLALLTLQAPERAGDLALWVEGPIKRFVAVAAGAVGRYREDRSTVDALERDNEELRNRLREVESAYAAAVGVRLEADLVSEPLRYEPPPRADLLRADIVYVDHRSFRRTAILHLPDGRDGEDWARRPVTTTDGLLGRVISASGNYARVLLVTDRDSSVGAMIERTRRQGIVRGTSEAGSLSLMFLPLQVDVRPGDRVITAGIDGVFPRGVPIGTITSVESDGDLFHDIRIVPSVDLGSLNHAFVWRREPLPEVFMDGGDGTDR